MSKCITSFEGNKESILSANDNKTNDSIDFVGHFTPTNPVDTSDYNKLHAGIQQKFEEIIKLNPTKQKKYLDNLKSKMPV